MKKLLLQFDSDPLPSTFDRVVASDAGADEIFAYGGVNPENVVGLVHGAMFTRGPQDLKSTAIFLGGSDVSAGEALLRKVTSTLFPPLQVSVMLDSNGSNTTAAAAVVCATQHLPLADCSATVLGGTGPVGFRVAQLLAIEGAQVNLVSRSLDRAAAACSKLRELVPQAQVLPLADPAGALCGAELLIAAGAAGVQFLEAAEWQNSPTLKVAIDLNAVPPLGLGGIQMQDRQVQHGNVICYGALGVGGRKMKIHKAAVAQLFERNDQVLDTAAIYRIAQSIR